MELKQVNITWLSPPDVKKVQQIENLSFDFPWSENQFFEVWRDPKSYTLAAKIGDELVGYLVYTRFSKKFVIENLAIHENHRRKGIGKKLIEMVISKLNKNRNNIEVFVCDSNLDAHLFLCDLGFKAVKVLRNYYDNNQDAYLFKLCG
jgi:[ribosomal protein S18]-alanine N-acetyltransferase